MKKIGITGGIGSGKTTVCKIFEMLGIPVYYADIRAKALMEEDHELIGSIISAFGDDTYSKGKLKRQRLAEIVFNDEAKLKTLNELVHPAVFRDNDKWLTAYVDAPYILKEAALIFESGSYKQLDAVITVFAEEETRIKRVLARDETTEDTVRARMKQQMPEEEKLNRSNYVIYNNDKDLLLPQVLKIHKEILNL